MGQVPPDISIFLAPSPPADDLQPPQSPNRASIWIYEEGNTDPNTAIEFPITPSEVPEQGSADPKQFRVIGYGQYSFPSGRNEQKYSLSGYFPGKRRFHPGEPYNNLPHTWNWRTPSELVSKIRGWLQNNTRLRYQVTSLVGTLSVRVYLNSYTFTRKGYAGDVDYQLEFVEWRAVGLAFDTPDQTTTGATGGDGVPGSDDGGGDETPTTYTVLSGDTLSLISKRFLGDSGRWREIYDANTDVIGDDPNVIIPGQVLTIPGGTVADPSQDGYASAGVDSTETTDTGD